MSDTRTREQMLDDIAKRAASKAVDQLKPAADAPAFSEAQVAALRDQFSDLLTHLTPEQKRTFVFAAGEGAQCLKGGAPGQSAQAQAAA